MRKRSYDPKLHVAAMYKYRDLKSDLRIKNNLKLDIRSRGGVRLYENSSTT